MEFTIHNIHNWVEDNKKNFVPPVCNKLMHNSQLKVFYVGGPNQRKDFHLEEGEEFFYQKKGDMVLRVLTQGKFEDIKIKEGEVFLLPCKTLHSPQRFEKTLGLVIERERLREPEERDCVRYFVDGTTDVLYERWFYCDDLGPKLGKIITEYFQSEQHRTGVPIPEDLTKDPPYQPDNIVLDKPFNLKDWMKTNKAAISAAGVKRLFGEKYSTEVLAYDSGTHTCQSGNTEMYLWILEGKATITVNDKHMTVDEETSILLQPNLIFTLNLSENCICLSIAMDSSNKGSK